LVADVLVLLDDLGNDVHYFRILRIEGVVTLDGPTDALRLPGFDSQLDNAKPSPDTAFRP